MPIFKALCVVCLLASITEVRTRNGPGGIPYKTRRNTLVLRDTGKHADDQHKLVVHDADKLINEKSSPEIESLRRLRVMLQRSLKNNGLSRGTPKGKHSADNLSKIVYLLEEIISILDTLTGQELIKEFSSKGGGSGNCDLNGTWESKKGLKINMTAQGCKATVDMVGESTFLPGVWNASGSLPFVERPFLHIQATELSKLQLAVFTGVCHSNFEENSIHGIWVVMKDASDEHFEMTSDILLKKNPEDESKINATNTPDHEDDDDTIEDQVLDGPKHIVEKEDETKKAKRTDEEEVQIGDAEERDEEDDGDYNEEYLKPKVNSKLTELKTDATPIKG